MSVSKSNDSRATQPQSALTIALNIISSPADAFRYLQDHPSKLLPLVTVVGSMLAVMFWYFSIVDFDWYIDDALAGANLEPDQMEQAREAMQNMSQNTFRAFGVIGGAATFLLLWIVQAGYLSLVSALNGDRYRFTHWFSLVLWAALPFLLSITGMAVTIALSPNGQLSAYALDPTTLANLGFRAESGSVQQVLQRVNLSMIWGLALTVMGYRQWLETGWARALTIVLAPYLLIIGIWAYFALT